MYNPFPLLTPGLLKGEMARGKSLFVRQTFPRGYEGRLKAAFLVRGYGAEERELAERHFATIARDPNAFLYDVSVPGHIERLEIAAGQPFGYKVFYAAKKGVEWKPPETYQEKMKAYIRRHHPGWRTKKDGDKIQIGLYEEFGELFLKFSYEEEHDTIPFDLIEKY
jgi:hypothetical protein